MRRDSGARGATASVVSAEASEADDVVRAAREAAERGDWSQAEEAWAQALDVSRGSPPTEIYAGLAAARRHLGLLDAAEEAARRGHEDRPGSPTILRELAEISSAREDWLEAVSRWSHVLQTQEGRAPVKVYLRLIAAQRRLGMFEEAEDTARRATRERPNNTRLAKSHAEVATDRGLWDEAARRWQRIIESADGKAPALAHVRLASAQRQLGQFDIAEDTTTRGMSEYPDNARIAVTHADIAMDRWDWPEAVARWARAVELAGSRTAPKWHHRRGLALERCGRYAEAAESYQRGIELLTDVQQGWAHAATIEWRFRRDYARRRAGLDVPSDPRLDCVVADAGGAGKNERAGLFEAEVAHMGLVLRGVVDPPAVDRVEIEVDGVPLKSVTVDEASVPPGFRFVIKHEALAAFPGDCEVGVRSKTGMLTTPAGSETVRLEIPYGDGSLGRRLEEGAVVTKKGQLVTAAGNAARGEGEMLWSPVGAEDRTLTAYTDLRRFFAEEFGRELFLLYGTLLGCYRDGHFIAEDDDVDVGFVADATDPVSLKAEALEVVRRLLRSGFDVSTRRQGSLLKVIVRGVDFDVFPVWFFRGRAWAHDAIVADRDDFLPTHRAEFLGTQVALPRNPETFLRGTYGEGWAVPDPSFRYYLSPEVRRVVDLTSLTPGEAQQLVEDNTREREQDPSVGTFTIAGALERGYLPGP